MVYTIILKLYSQRSCYVIDNIFFFIIIHFFVRVIVVKYYI